MPSNKITKDVLSYSTQRVTFTSPKPLKDVLVALDRELNSAGAGVAVMKMLATAQNREDIEKGMDSMTDNGKLDFVLFAGGSHSKWLDAYFNGSRTFPETQVFTIGNPLIAQAILQQDLTAGLHIPPKFLVQEGANGKGTILLYDLPSSVMVLGEDEGLLNAAKALDDKLERMVLRVLEE